MDAMPGHYAGCGFLFCFLLKPLSPPYEKVTISEPHTKLSRNKNATSPKHTTANLKPTSSIAGANLKTKYAIAQNPINSNIIFAPCFLLCLYYTIFYPKGQPLF
jgi:hypothetical protein